VTGLVNPDRRHIELLPIDCIQDRSRRQQRNLMLAAPPAKQNPNPQFFSHFSLIVGSRQMERDADKLAGAK
jgi:hypothetical protein